MASDIVTFESTFVLHVRLGSGPNPEQHSKIDTVGLAAPPRQAIAAGVAPSEEQPSPTAPIPIRLTLQNTSYERHTKQSINLPEPFPINTPEFPISTDYPLIPIGDRYRHFKLAASINGTKVSNEKFISLNKIPLLQPSIYLFNVIVALEWRPSRSTIQQLMDAFRAASDFLYDCTNGSMALGQVIFAADDDTLDDTLMDQADIQIMASNRFYPRSLVNALNEPDKFSPIRLGRGLWNKDSSVLIPWDEPIGYRTIIHEWGHYALSLRDEYIDETRVVKPGARPSQLVMVKKKEAKTPVVAGANQYLPSADEKEKVLVVPSFSVSLESIMATLDSSEIVPKQRKPIDDVVRERLLNEVDIWFPGVGKALTNPANPGPKRLPLPLPQFYSTFDTKDNDYTWEERLLDVESLRVNGQPLQHCWLYLLCRNNETQLFEQIVAQGTIDARAQDQTLDEGTVKGLGFQLLGDTSCNEVLAIGYDKVDGYDQMVLEIRRAALPKKPKTGDSSIYVPEKWEPVSAPPVLPVVTVIPTDALVDWPEVVVKVRVVGGEQPTKGWIVPSGKSPLPLPDFPKSLTSGKFQYWESEFLHLSGLDGLVVLQYRDGDGSALWVCEYSHGGNPPTSIRTRGAPVSAGSSDGNLMLYCRTTKDDPTQFASKRVVTTRNYVTFSEKDGLFGTYQFDATLEAYCSEGKLPGQPASYLFSVASNEALPMNDLHPTIVMYFDIRSLDDEGDLVIYRYDYDIEQNKWVWVELPTYSPPGAFFAAIPLDRKSGPTLTSERKPANDRIEYYQLFRVKD